MGLENDFLVDHVNKLLKILSLVICFFRDVILSLENDEDLSWLVVSENCSIFAKGSSKDSYYVFLMI